jgi:hypothetical protein
MIEDSVSTPDFKRISVKPLKVAAHNVQPIN